MKHCYDFPMVVLHRLDCPRSQPGGMCHPEPMPIPPYNDEQAEAVSLNAEIVGGHITQDQMVPIYPLGNTGAIRGTFE